MPFYLQMPQDMNSTTRHLKFSYILISSLCSVFTFHFGLCLRQRHICYKLSLAQVIKIVAE